MPELPEVETVVRDLRPLLVGRVIRGVHASALRLRRPWRPDWGKLLLARRFDGVRRRGKWILLDLDDASCLVVHLGMTGQFTTADSADETDVHTHLRFDLDDGRQLRFRDIRRFGSVELFAPSDDLQAFLGDRLGPEPWELTESDFHATLRRTHRCLKAALLDQRVVAGVGNIYADEALFEAKFHPATHADTLTASQAARLRAAIVTVLERAIARRGSTIRNYVGGSGLQGGYQQEFRAYGRTGEPCGRCGTAIEVVRLAGRSSHYCPRCQKDRSPAAGKPAKVPPGC